MRNVQGTELTDFEDHVEKAKFGPRHLVNVKVAIDSLLLNQNKAMNR